MANITPFWLDSFGHQLLSTHLYTSIGGVPDTTINPFGGGTACLRVTSTAAEYVNLGVAAGKRLISVGFYIQFFSSVPAEDTRIFQLTNANGSAEVVYDASSNQFGIENNTIELFGPTLSAGQWYQIIFEVDSSTGTQQAKISIDGTTYTHSGNTQTAADLTGYFLGRLAAVSTSRTYFISDFWMSETDGDFEIAQAWDDWGIQDQRPVSDGTHGGGWSSGDFGNDATAGVGAYTTSSTDVNDMLDHSALVAVGVENSSYLRNFVNDGSDYVELVMGNIADLGTYDGIDGVRTIGSHLEAGASGASLAEMRLLTSGGTEIVNSGGLSMIDSTNDPGTSPTARQRMMVAPGGTWDDADITDMLVRIGFGDANPDVIFFNCYYEVMFHNDPAAATGFMSVIITGT